MSTLETNLIQPSTGTSLTLGASGDTITIPSGVTITNNGTQSGFGGTNTPNFYAYRSGDQTGLTSEAWTKVQLNAEAYDSANAFDSSTNYRFTVPSGQGGKYCFLSSVAANAGDNNLTRLHSALYKNGSEIARMAYSDWTNQAFRNLESYGNSVVLNLSASDYIELYAKVYTGSGTGTINADGGAASTTRLVGFKIIE